ncbi:MAG: TIR domain-containing protein [Pseudomonadota bacterium]
MDDDMVIEPTMAQKKYGAFISYSHADAATVAKLHKQLEAYRLPKGLGSINALNASKSGLGKVFRDREDLSAAENLSDAVTDALGRSQVLVVVCSPEAKASRWVSQEIAFFRENCPGSPILAAIVRGEPADAFPEALTQGGTEPLAADLRKEGDGWKLGFLKVVAGIAGVPLDALVQRDSQRQMRRVMAVTGVTALVAVAMGVMTTLAIQARDEAQMLRVNGDEFINELLTDGREDLVGVGRLDVLDKFNERALRFYEKQGDPRDLPDDSLENWARILHVIGEDETKKVDGDLDKALGIFGLASSATEELVKRQPANPDRLQAHGHSLYWVGRVSELRSEFAKAETSYIAYHANGLKLSEAEPDSYRTAIERGYGDLNLGILAFARENYVEAGKKFDLAIQQFQAAERKKPEDRTALEELANALAWRFDTHYKAGEFAEALAVRQNSASIIGRIVTENPKDREAQFSLQIAQRAIALTRCELGQVAEARRALGSAIDGMGDLVRLDPNNGEWSEFRSKAQKNLETIERTGGKSCL